MFVYKLKQRINSYRYRYLSRTINASIIKRCEYVIKRNIMEQYAMHCEKKGISDDSICEEELIVSLTTYKSRLNDVFLAIESIMQGSVKPNRIILWVSEELKGTTLPTPLQKQMKRGLEIRYVKDIGPYTKLIYALKEFPHSSIITIDDDIIYPFDTVENLVNAHNTSKGLICANDYVLAPYHLKKSKLQMMKWKRPKEHLSISDRCIFEGFAGVLYPPHCFNEEVFNEDLFLKICKTSDDVWFSAMAILNGTKCIYACPNMDGFRIVSNYLVQGSALCLINDKMNGRNIYNVFKRYSIY